MRAARGRALPDWPDWCFLPLAAAIAIITRGGAVVPQDGLDPARLAALAAWRVTQGIYRFDPDVYSALIDTPLSGDIPHEVLYRLPEWCVYVETPGMMFDMRPVHGFFAHLEAHFEQDRMFRTELRLLLDTDELIPVILHLGPWSLVESIERMLEEARRMAAARGDITLQHSMFGSDLASALAECVTPMVSLIMYLCSINAELSGEPRPSRPAPKKTRRGTRYFPPEHARVWEVGIRIGAAIRAARARPPEEEHAEKTIEGGGARQGVRPHIRRAHWHGYWTGPRSGKRRFTLKWLPPIPVAVQSVVELPAVIRTVH